MARRKSDGEGKGKTTAATTPARQTRSMDRTTRSQTQRNSSGGGSSSSSSKLMAFESPEKRKKRKSKAKETGPTTKKIKQEMENDEEETAVEEDDVAAEEGEGEGDDDSEHKKIVIERCKMNEDMISELPEALLLHILSYVPTKDVIAASVLSKRWRSVWKMVPKLKFESDTDHVSSEDVYRLLLLHKAPFLESLHLDIKDTKGRLNIGILIGIAFARHVRELVLDFYNEDQKKVKFPSVLCSYNNTLEVLKLEDYVLLHFPSRVCFNALRELVLYRVEFKDEASVCNLLSGCPRLQDLVVTRHWGNFDAEIYTIAVPSLQRLTIEEDSSTNVDRGGYVIRAPSLKYLNIRFLSFMDFFLMENAPELVEAKICRIPHIANENIIASLTSAKRLSLYLPLEIKYPTGSIFFQLVSLDLRINELIGWNLFPFMLESSPKLQILKLVGPYFEECPVGWEWNQPRRVPECLLLHLETLVWKIYKWQREDEKQVATYILKNARQLKKATFSTTYIEPKELEQLEKRREILNELSSIVRASTLSHLVFESR